MRNRKALADLLIRAAFKLDPNRPRVLRERGGGHVITFGSVPLARISAGMINDKR